MGETSILAPLEVTIVKPRARCVGHRDDAAQVEDSGGKPIIGSGHEGIERLRTGFPLPPRPQHRDPCVA